MKKLFGMGMIILIIYGFYSMGKAGHSYIIIGDLLDEIVPRQIGMQGVADQQGAQERNERIRAVVVASVTEAGFPIDKSDVSFSEDQGKLSVRVQRQHPVVTYQGETKVAIPVAVTSNFLLPVPRN
jgi:hypothetical protein